MENVTKHWSNSWLGNCEIVSEERLQQVPHINYLLRLSFERLKSWLIKNYWITNYQNKCKTKICGFYMQRIILSSIKSRGTLKTICDVNILLGNAIKHIFSYPLKYSSWLFTASKYVFSLSKTWFFKLLRYLLTTRNLSIQIFNLNIQVSLALKLIVQLP